LEAIVNVLLLYPKHPDTFWSFRQAVRVSSKRAVFPPLGLLTVASMLPEAWSKRVIDLNTDRLHDDDISGADLVFISAMVIQRDSAADIVARCNRLGVKVVAGGPLFTTEPDEFSGVDYLVLDEAEVTLPLFLTDLQHGSPQHIYTSQERPPLTSVPLPMWSLIDMSKYVQMSLQYSRGCPFDCDFCNIGVLNGKNVRTKSKEQLLGELDALYHSGWRSAVFVVDDNFIGNKKKLKDEILPAMIEWQKARRYPFTLSTQVSINLSDDDGLMGLLTEAGFDGVFVGIESPNEDSLAECNKHQNEHRDLVASVKKLQSHGLQVQAGLILGFDSDPVSVFNSQAKFVQQSGIVMAMVGLLNAPRGTRLFKRMEHEKRLLEDKATGDNTDCSMNFVPKMERATLVKGYIDLLGKLYSPAAYYHRIGTFFSSYKPREKHGMSQLKWWQAVAWVRSLWIMGVRDSARVQYWRFMWTTLVTRPRSFPLSITLAVYGYHFRSVLRTLEGSAASV
jgi:radical SAM superfamily enzyme YgiQ (UPF0313 family)